MSSKPKASEYAASESEKATASIALADKQSKSGSLKA